MQFETPGRLGSRRSQPCPKTTFLRPALVLVWLAIIAFADTSLAIEIHKVANEADWKRLPKLQGGDIVLVRAGRMNNVSVDIETESVSEDAQVHVLAEDPGQTVFTGATRIVLDGDVVGINHVIRGNTFYRLGGEKLRAALCLMDGKYGDTSSDRYEGVENTLIERNVFYDCRQPVNMGECKGPADPPKNIVFKDNLIRSNGDGQAFRIEQDVTVSVSSGNRAFDVRGKYGSTPPGTETGPFELNVDLQRKPVRPTGVKPVFEGGLSASYPRPQAAKPADASAQTPAFPGAEGYGAMTAGGRGGRVIKVANLNPRGPGSLQAACSASGARTIVFTVSGVVRGDVVIEHGEISIMGQTAPGAGITIAGMFSTRYNSPHPINDVIVRFLRVRPPNARGSGGDAIQFSQAQRVILDHVSCSWASDETVDIYGARDVTVQWCAIEESAVLGHPKGRHNYGLISGPRGGRVSIIPERSHQVSRPSSSIVMNSPSRSSGEQTCAHSSLSLR